MPRIPTRERLSTRSFQQRTAAAGSYGRESVYQGADFFNARAALIPQVAAGRVRERPSSEVGSLRAPGKSFFKATAKIPKQRFRVVEKSFECSLRAEIADQVFIASKSQRERAWRPLDHREHERRNFVGSTGIERFARRIANIFSAFHNDHRIRKVTRRIKSNTTRGPLGVISLCADLLLDECEENPRRQWSKVGSPQLKTKRNLTFDPSRWRFFAVAVTLARGGWGVVPCAKWHKPVSPSCTSGRAYGGLALLFGIVEDPSDAFDRGDPLDRALPDANDSPALSTQGASHAKISAPVVFNLRFPEADVRRRDRPALGASVPEASVDEDGDLASRPSEVRLAENRPVFSIAAHTGRV